MNLQMKMLLPIILLIALICGVSGYLSYDNAAKNLESALVDNMRGEAQALTRALAKMEHSARTDIKRVADMDQIEEFMKGMPQSKEKALEFSKWFDTIQESYPDFERLSVVDLNGKVIASSLASSVGTDVSDREYFKDGMAGKISFTDPFKSSITGKGVIAAGAPVKMDGKIVGIAYGILTLDNIYTQAVAPVSVGKTGYAFVLGPKGFIILHKNADWTFNPNLPSAPYYREMASADKEGVKDFIGNAGSRVFNYYAKEPISGLTAVIQAEYADVFEGLASMRYITIVVCLVSILVGAILVLLILRPVITALKAGMNFAGKIAAGDLSGTLNIHRKDELGKLADALRAIPASLKEIVAEYESLGKSVETGRLGAEGDAGRFSGEFAALIQGTNNVLRLFRTVIDSIPSPVVMLDKDLRIRYMNNVARALAPGEYEGRTCGDVFHRDDYGTPADALARAASSGQTCSAETRAHPAGKDIDVSYTSIPLRDSQGRLAAVLQLMIDLTAIKSTQRTILEVASQATDISNRVAAASEQLSAQVEQVSRGTDVQRDRVGSTATAMEEMNATVMEVARSAGQASEQAENTRSRANEGAALVDKVIAAIRQVNAVAVELQGNMQELGQQAESIGGVMNVISDIADQTNLLALNAAIEAARAGEAGRGFAVVADEVRKLAEKTMGATSEVGSSIRGIQTATGNNIKRVGEAAKSVTEATELAGTSGAALQEIVNLAAQNSSLIASIATAAEEQSATSEEINRAVEEVNRIASETSAGMAQSASAVQELSGMAQELKSLLLRLQK